jgi:hypothetical protein
LSSYVLGIYYSYASGTLLDFIFESVPSLPGELKMGDLRFRDIDGLTGPGISAHSCSSIFDEERSEPPELNSLAFGQQCNDLFQRVFQDYFNIFGIENIRMRIMIFIQFFKDPVAQIHFRDIHYNAPKKDRKSSLNFKKNFRIQLIGGISVDPRTHSRAQMSGYFSCLTF